MQPMNWARHTSRLQLHAITIQFQICQSRDSSLLQYEDPPHDTLVQGIPQVVDFEQHFCALIHRQFGRVSEALMFRLFVAGQNMPQHSIRLIRLLTLEREIMRVHKREISKE